MEKNIVYVGRGEKHPALYTDTLTATEASWVTGERLFDLPFRCKAKVRYRQKDQACIIDKITEDGVLHIRFTEPQRAVTSRQSIVFYKDDVCLGGAIIEHPGPTYLDIGKPLSFERNEKEFIHDN